MADNAPPRRGIGAFHGGPLGIGWAPWAIGAAALVVGVYLFTRRGAGAAGGQAGQAGGALPMGLPYPYPTGGTNQQPSGQPPSPGSNPSAQQLQLVVRAATSSGPLAGYDASAAGPPVRTQASDQGPSLGTVPFGSTVTATGIPLTGTANFLGNTTWWPIKYGGTVGYLSGSDVAASNPSAQQVASMGGGNVNLAA